ncbi:exonuclease SbcCD subunit D [Macrococcus sp. DPC7161]|uniref:exonuclease SbcCD subunit D n=1 Tax=Macrococcus sp. DPC7161 TaxID=2507060 RepID=UPI00100AB21A|nr:exonuclease SbcCD subunit D [Macrococcus sp. DPC7161]RXK19137.1 exonuclease SbcCD subunit D [Macrococcus sp. DPC7161]
MKIMHLGDLHIGKKINGHLLLDDQKFMIDQYIKIIDEKQFDVVIIAGDVYDRSIPSIEAIQLFEYFVKAVNVERNIPLFVVTGNHDGASRMMFGHQFFKDHAFYLNASIQQAFQPVALDDVHFYLVPYIDTDVAKYYFKDETLKTHGQVYQRIIEAISDVLDDTKQNVLVSHLFITGSETTDSEKELSIGTIDNVDVNMFKPFDLVLLGHLHHPFALTHDRVFYSGSMLKFSFSEVNQPKGYRYIEYINNEWKVQFVPIAPKTDMEHIVSDFDAIITKKVTPKNPNSYIKFELSGLHLTTDPMRRLKEMYPNTLELKPIVEAIDEVKAVVDVMNKTDFEIIASFYESFHQNPLSTHQVETIQRILKEVQHETD